MLSSPTRYMHHLQRETFLAPAIYEETTLDSLISTITCASSARKEAKSPSWKKPSSRITNFPPLSSNQPQLTVHHHPTSRKWPSIRLPSIYQLTSFGTNAWDTFRLPRSDTCNPPVQLLDSHRSRTQKITFAERALKENSPMHPIPTKRNTPRLSNSWNISALMHMAR